MSPTKERTQKCKVVRGKFISNYAAMTYRLHSTGEEKRIGMNLGALTGYVKSFENHWNAEVIKIEVPHGWVQKTKEFLRKQGIEVG